MASYHLHVRVISRGAGRSAPAAAAYRSCSRIKDRRQGICFDYVNKRGLAHSEILLPQGAPCWSGDRESLWNAVEAAEKRKDAQLARDLDVALPKELSLSEQINLLREFCQENFVSLGMIADINLHTDDKNPHAHIMLTLREVTPDGFGKKERSWNRRDNLLLWRENWARAQNLHLARSGFEVSVDHRSHADRGLDLEPLISVRAKDYMRGRESLERMADYRRITRNNGNRIIKTPSVALDFLTYQKSVFTETDLKKLALKYSVDQRQYQAVLSAVEKDRDIFPLGQNENGKRCFTSRRLLEAEQRMFKSADKMAKKSRHAIREKFIQQAEISRTLTDEQKNACRNIVAGGDVVAVIGHAGTGKSYTLGAVREAFEAGGYRVSGMALSGIAAQGLEAGSGIKSTTLHRRLFDWENGRDLPDKKTILVVDEAGMVGTRQMHRVVEAARIARAKLVLVGDFEQLQAIEAGGPFRGICERVGACELTGIMRQRHSWQREATALLSESAEDVSRAIDLYDRNGHIHLHEKLEDAKAALIAHWQQEIGRGDSRIILSYRNLDVGDLNRRAREVMKESGRIKGPEKRFETVKGELAFGVGDRILFLRNERSMGVKNGSLATVEAVKETALQVRLDDGSRLSFDPHFYDHFTHGYAATIHKAQGVTVDQAYVLATRHFDKHLTYVGLSRHREAIQVYASRDGDGFKNYAQMKVRMGRARQKELVADFGRERGVAVDLSRIYRKRYFEIQVAVEGWDQRFCRQVVASPLLNHEESRQYVHRQAERFAELTRERAGKGQAVVVTVRELDYESGRGVGEPRKIDVSMGQGRGLEDKNKRYRYYQVHVHTEKLLTRDHYRLVKVAASLGEEARQEKIKQAAGELVQEVAVRGRITDKSDMQLEIMEIAPEKGRALEIERAREIGQGRGI